MNRAYHRALIAFILLGCGEGSSPAGTLIGSGSEPPAPNGPTLVDPTPNGPDGPNAPPILSEEFPAGVTVPDDPCLIADAGCGVPAAADAGPACGDGALDDGEACDDGNGAPGDGCSGACQVEPNFACPSPGVPCRSSATDPEDGSSTNVNRTAPGGVCTVA